MYYRFDYGTIAMQTNLLIKRIGLLGIAATIALLCTGAPVAHAQATSTSPGGNISSGAAVGGALGGAPGAVVGGVLGGVLSTPGGQAGATTLANGGTVQQAASAAQTATVKSVGDTAISIGTAALDGILGAIVTMVGFLLGLSGVIFNWVIVVTVFQFANYFGNSGGMLIAWGILRDLGNILLLFGFIFMGICTILDIQSFSAKKALPSLLIFAVLLNFSLFAGEIIIDGANLLSASLYEQAGSSSLGSSCQSITTNTNIQAGSSNNCAEVGIAGQILTQSKISTIYDASGVPPTANNQLLVDTGMIVLMGIVMIVLLAGSVMFFTRAVMLVILLILSPIGFAGMAIPPLQGMAREWWQRLISNAFFAPIFLLIIFIGLKVMQGITNATGAAGQNFAAALASPGVATGDLFILFALVIGFMVAALMFARSSGAAGAEFATKFAQRTVLAPVNATRRIVGAGARGVGNSAGGFAYRNTAGRAAAGLSNRYNTTIGGLKQKGGFVGGAAKMFDHSIGGAVDGGLHAAQTAKVGDRSYTEQKKYIAGRDTETAHANEMAHLNRDLNDGIKNGNTDQIERSLQKMSVADIEKTKYAKEGAKGIEQIAKALSTDKFEKLMESKEVNAHVKDQIAAARFEEFRAASDPANGTASARYAANKDNVRKWANEDLVALAKYDPDTYKKLVETNDYDDANNTGTGDSILSGDQYKALKSNKSLTTSQRNTLNEHTKGGLLIGAIKNNNTIKIENITKTIQNDIADLPNSVLTNTNVMNSYTPNQLSAIMKKNKLSPAEIKAIATAVNDAGHPNKAKIDAWFNKTAAARTYWS